MDFFRDLKENLDKNNTLSKITDGIAEFIGELAEALQKEGITGKDVDIVTQIANTNKLSIASENEIYQERKNVLQEYANSTKDEGNLYFVFNKVKNENEYRIWTIDSNGVTQNEVRKNDLPNDISVNSAMRVNNGKFILDSEATKVVTNEIRNRANKIIEEQNKKIQEYKKEGHTYLVTEDINGRIFLWDSTEKPKFEIEDVNFPEELKDKAKEGNSFLYKDGTYTYIS